MKRPKQLPAVDRNSNKCASVPVGAKVSPSDWLSDLGVLGGLVGPLLGGLS
jgi:hypothetical protein